MSKRKGLGRGLSALIADMDTGPTQISDSNTEPVRADKMVSIELVYANPNQPRKDFNEDELQDLANSISEKGIIQPIIVRANPKGDGKFEIVAGERRWRAAQLANLHEIPVLVRELTDTEVFELAIIENVQRSDLNAYEEALGYRQLMDEFGHTQEQMSKVIGKSRSHIANLLRLLSLPNQVLNLLRDGQITTGHARCLVPIENPINLANMIVKNDLSVRQTEQLARLKNPASGLLKTKPVKDANTVLLEKDITAQIGAKTVIDHQEDSERGLIKIKYKSLDQLEEICQLLLGQDKS